MTRESRASCKVSKDFLTYVSVQGIYVHDKFESRSSHRRAYKDRPIDSVGDHPVLELKALPLIFFSFQILHESRFSSIPREKDILINSNFPQ